MYILQNHQRPDLLIGSTCLYGRLKIPWVSKGVGLGFLLLISYIISLPIYKWNTVVMAKTTTKQKQTREPLAESVSIQVFLAEWHGTCGLVSHGGSTMKSPWMRTSWYPTWYDLRCCQHANLQQTHSVIVISQSASTHCRVLPPGGSKWYQV